MALVVPDEGEKELLDKMLLDALSVDENYILKLFKNDFTPANTTSAGSLTEADFTSYVAKTLTRSGWAVGVTNGSNKAETSYGGGTPQSWTSGTTGNTIYGYYIVGATSTAVLWAERFATARVLSDGDVLNLTPKFTLNSEN
jgi:hypothetical protein